MFCSDNIPGQRTLIMKKYSATMSLILTKYQTMTSISDVVESFLVKKLYHVVQTLRKFRPDRSSQVDTVCDVQPCIKQLPYPNAHTALLFIPNQTQTPSLQRNHGRVRQTKVVAVKRQYESVCIFLDICLTLKASSRNAL